MYRLFQDLILSNLKKKPSNLILLQIHSEAWNLKCGYSIAPPIILSEEFNFTPSWGAQEKDEKLAWIFSSKIMKLTN